MYIYIYTCIITGLIAINLITGGYLIPNVKFTDHVTRSIGLSPMQRTSKKKPVAVGNASIHGGYQTWAELIPPNIKHPLRNHGLGGNFHIIGTI
jgi:hypothetical protein